MPNIPNLPSSNPLKRPLWAITFGSVFIFAGVMNLISPFLFDFSVVKIGAWLLAIFYGGLNIYAGWSTMSLHKSRRRNGIIAMICSVLFFFAFKFYSQLQTRLLIIDAQEKMAAATKRRY